MRIWSLDPCYLDARGLVALWREGLLAQAVLRGKTKGYRNHPQLARFRAQRSPVACMATYLRHVHQEAVDRGYNFDLSRVAGARTTSEILVTDGQLLYEWEHLERKLQVRDPEWLKKVCQGRDVIPHPLFRVVRGGPEPWEKISRASVA